MPNELTVVDDQEGLTRATAAPWWRDAVIYEVYVRSFADADGDGMGDLAGVRSRLPYLRDLGVDAVWLTPFYPSPQADAGYDVADYRGVDPRFGSLGDFDGVVTDAHELGLRVLVDLVPNHTSSEHPWFRAALAAAPGSPERARYLFRDGRGPGGDQPPNNWTSVFGGPAWTRVPADADGRPGQWYLHLFASEQPDLDWTNPEVRAEFLSILRFWLDRGVDGFRIDVAQFSAMADGAHPHWDLDEVHDVYREWRAVADAYPGDRTFVAEVWVQSAKRLARYLRPDELHTAFNFGFLLAPWDPGKLRRAIDRSLAPLGEVGAPATWVLSNHDVVRHVTRYGGGAAGVARARAAALLMLALPGGAYVYQGEELGLPEVTDLPDDVLQDPSFSQSGGQQRGRDGCRVPLPWSGDAPPFGFGPSGEPWLPQPPAWATLTAAVQAEDPASMLTLYRTALRLRRDEPALGDGTLEWLPAPEGILAFRRPGPPGQAGVACVVNLGSGPAPVADTIPASAELLLSSGPLGTENDLPPDTAAWYRLP